MARLLVALAFVGTLLLTALADAPGGLAAQAPAALTLDPRTLAATAPAAFLPGETVALWYNRLDGTATDLGTTTALDDGRLAWALDAAAFGAIPGDALSLVARGWTSRQRAVYTFPGAGSWLNTDPCVGPATPDAGGNFVCTGPSLWRGPLLTGTTVYTTTYTIDPTTGTLTGTIDETFTGTAADGARGTIHFSETIRMTLTAAGDRYSVAVEADATGGTGDFCQVTGHLSFGGSDDLAGIGSGPYSGHIVAPRACR